MVIREALTVAAAGMAVAAPLAWWSSRLVASQLYGVSAGDPATALAAVVLLGAVSFLAGARPVRPRRPRRAHPRPALRVRRRNRGTVDEGPAVEPMLSWLRGLPAGG